MGKRSTGQFQRVEKDFYPTPIEAVEPLIPHLPSEFTFAEPCAGDGRLARHIEKLTGFKGRCVYAADVDPKHPDVEQRDAFSLTRKDFFATDADFVLTNPPWSRSLLHGMIERFVYLGPTWLLFDANWMFTKQSAPYMRLCRKIVPIGRVKWIENSKHVGKDDSCWYLFQRDATITEFVARAA